MENVSSVKSPNWSHSFFFFILKTRNKTISKANLLIDVYVLLPGVGQVGTLATYKDTGITNSCFWKLGNTKPNTSPLAPLPQCASASWLDSNKGTFSLKWNQDKEGDHMQVESGQLFSKPFRQSKASTPFRPHSIRIQYKREPSCPCTFWPPAKAQVYRFHFTNKETEV